MLKTMDYKWEIYELINNKLDGVDSIHVGVFTDEIILNLDNGKKVKIQITLEEGKK